VRHPPGHNAPKLAGRLDDLAVPVADLLRQLPGVADVKVLVRAAKPRHRIVHPRDWPFASKGLIRQHADRPRSDKGADALHRADVLEVELVQREPEALLRCLVQHHGLKRLLAEGRTPKGMPAYREVIATLRDTDQELADLRTQPAQVKKSAPAIDRQIEELVHGHRWQLPEYGAAARLALAGEGEVLPLE
jgi:hypothetical protein